jgi:hypothetical protein
MACPRTKDWVQLFNKFRVPERNFITVITKFATDILLSHFNPVHILHNILSRYKLVNASKIE